MTSHLKGRVNDIGQLARRIRVARGEEASDLVITGAQWLDVFTGAWQSGDVAVFDGVIVGVGDHYEAREKIDGTGKFIVPGFIDAHVHVESSMMTPARFEEAVLPRGTTSVIWDPHEIANVKGIAGIQWALEASDKLRLDFFVMVPSCVPSTSLAMGLETSGATLGSEEIKTFRDHPRVLGLAEMMNWPGLLSQDLDVTSKLYEFQTKRRDGHCPLLTGKDLNAYATAGIHSCHESTSLPEAEEKLSKGIHLLIREGSCAKDADRLLPALSPRSSGAIGFCSDDRNPLDIEEGGHVDCIVTKALQRGIDPIDVFKSSSYAAANMYGLHDRGAIAPGFVADLVLLCPRSDGHWKSGIRIEKVWKRGHLEAGEGSPRNNVVKFSHHKLLGTAKNLNIGFKELTDAHFKVTAAESLRAKSHEVLTCSVIGVRPGQIVTDHKKYPLPVIGNSVSSDPSRDILKIAVIERHHGLSQMGVGFVEGFGLKSGAIATSINHDCHNIIVTGSSDALMRTAVQELLAMDGGIVVVTAEGQKTGLRLPIGGLMTDVSPSEISSSLRDLKVAAKSIGCVLEEPFLQLSFLALPVIPNLKITDRGLVDGLTFQLISVVEGENINV